MKRNKIDSCGMFGMLVELPNNIDCSVVTDWSEEGLKNNPNIISASEAYEIVSPYTNATYYLNKRKIK